METSDKARPSLSLRFREPGDVSAPDVAAFSARVRAPVRADEPIAVSGRGSLPVDDEPLRVFFQLASFPIPRIERCDRIGPPNLDCWSLRPTAFGYVAEVAPRRTTGRVTSWLFAACLPLAVAMPRLAAAREGAPVQRPKSAPPKLPDPEPTPPVEPIEPTEAPPSDGTEVPAPDPLVAEGTPIEPVLPPPAPEPAPSSEDPAILDAAWEGVDDMLVDLRLKGGAKMRGRVGAVQRDTFTLIQDETGAVLVLPKSGVRSLRVRTPPPMPPQSGVGAIAGGVVLTSLGTPVFISGVALVAVCPSCTYIHLPLLFIGAGALGGGIPLLVRGARRREKWRAAIEARELSGGFSPTRSGWTGSIRFRF